jgi:protein-tyrosine-phosphatase
VREWWARRRAPRRLRACAPVTRLLVLCTANRVRSPFAERWLQAQLGERVRVTSRGFLPGGAGCPPEALEVAARYGVILEGHVAQQLGAQELLTASAVLLMEQRMLRLISTRYPALTPRLLPLGWYDPERGWGADIDDPFQLTREDYDASYERIVRCCGAVVAQLTHPS